jgi:ribosomal protein L6P/L9E
MLFIKNKKKILNISLILTNLKLKKLTNIVIYIKGFYGVKTLVFKFKFNQYLNLNFLKEKLKNILFELNVGAIGTLYLNGLGFKSTRKLFSTNKKHWRFNVGHSHVFQYFTPKTIIMKVKQRFIFMFGINKSQVFDILKKIKSFHVPDSYKGVGIKYPNEYIRLKKGKTRQ